MTMEDERIALRELSRFLGSNDLVQALFQNQLGGYDSSRIIARFWYNLVVMPRIIARSLVDRFLHFLDQIDVTEFRQHLPRLPNLNRRMVNPINFSMFERTPSNIARNGVGTGVWPEIPQDSVTGRMISEMFYPAWRASRAVTLNAENAGPDGWELTNTGEPDVRWNRRHTGNQFSSIGDAAGRTKSWYTYLDDALGTEFQFEAKEQMQLYKPGN